MCGVAAAGNGGRSGLGQVGSGAGAVLTTAGIVFAYACLQGAAASNFGSASGDTGLVCILTRVLTSAKVWGGADRGSQGQSSEKSLGKHIDDLGFVIGARSWCCDEKMLL